MNTLHLKYAVEIEKTGSITQAAENLFMAQPNLSKAIKELEDALGLTIFERSSKGVLPTKSGMEFLKYARNILAQIEQIELLGSGVNPDDQSFSISVPRSSYISEAISDYINWMDQRSFDNIDHINIKETNSVNTINGVAEGLYNLGIIRYQPTHEKYFMDCLEERNLCNDLIWEFESLCLMSKQHPLAYVPNLRYEDLSHFTEIREGDMTIPYLSANGNAARGKNEKPAAKKIIVYDRGSKFDIISKVHNAYTLEAPLQMVVENRFDLVQRKYKGSNNKYKDLLIYRKGYEISEIDKNFLERLYAIKNEIAYKNYN